jgi:anaerobic selenocysteine-containing dehydrogenase
VHHCDVAITVEGDRAVSVRGDEADPFSKGYVCPKAAALVDLSHDPDRLRSPMTREAWREASWDEALDLSVSRP